MIFHKIFPLIFHKISTIFTVHEWAWDETLITSASVLSKDNLEVTFHPVYSESTAAVRGNRAMEKDRHHYWEVKMLTPIYGTDIVRLQSFQTFHSWGTLNCSTIFIHLFIYLWEKLFYKFF